jgi:16S rRNA (guanine966-N2)-methyltransferase
LSLIFCNHPAAAAPGSVVDRRDSIETRALKNLRNIKKTSTAAVRRSPALHRIRIIGGRYRRTPIPVPDSAELRPTPDRVRETLFNWLSHLRDDLESVRGLDLFAGSGVLGFELASRGAREVVLVERDRALARRLIGLRERLAAHEVQVICGDAIAVGEGLPPASFDLIFLDPPYHGPLLRPALQLARRLLAPDGWVYAETDSDLSDSELKALGLQPVRSGRAGRVHFYLLGLQQS